MGRPNALKLHMRRKDLSDLFLLAAIWGGSFLFMRMAVGDLGPIVLSALRTLIAGSLLLPVLVWRKKLPLLFKSWRPIVIVGLLNAVLPFLFLSYARSENRVRKWNADSSHGGPEKRDLRARKPPTAEKGSASV